MDTEEQISQSSQHNSEEDENSSSSDNEPAMVVTRERRANAGNRMAKLLELAGAEEEEEHTEEDEYADIFLEAANDQEFAGEGAEDGDVDMSSSSEEEDGEGGDEEQGEKELQKSEKEGQGKKRKALSLLQQTMKLKKLRYAPILKSQESTPGPSTPDSQSRPKKKSERTSWLPDSSAVRASTRRLAVQNKQATVQKLKENEKKRVSTLAKMQAAEERKKTTEKKPMTQEERLAHAAEVERENVTTVNRWETLETQRQEERKAKLAALKSRRLEGPVITYYSGPALWSNDTLKGVGKQRLIEIVDEDEKKAQKKLQQSSVDGQINGDLPIRPSGSDHADSVLRKDSSMEIDSKVPNGNAPGSAAGSASTDTAAATAGAERELSSSAMDVDPPPVDIVKTAGDQPSKPPGFLDGIEYWASLPRDGSQSTPGAHQEPRQTLASILAASPSANPQSLNLPPAAPPTTPAPIASQPPAPSTSMSPAPLLSGPSTSTPLLPHPSALSTYQSVSQYQFPSPPKPEPLPEVQLIARRSLITLTSFPKLDARTRKAEREHEAESTTTGGRWGGARVSAAEKDKDMIIRTLFTVPPAPPTDAILPPIGRLSISEAALDPNAVPKPEELSNYNPLIPASSHPRHNTRYISRRAMHCVITGQVARYRDPQTALPYATSDAYKSIRNVVSGQGRWSDMLQCWLGDAAPAKGVPKGVWFGKDSPEGKEEAEQLAKKKAAEDERKAAAEEKAKSQASPSTPSAPVAPASGPVTTPVSKPASDIVSAPASVPVRNGPGAAQDTKEASIAAP
ncbi:YL1-domain-containing protein [Microthyrium microscopicum]|uniref:YL1-domain-containing protein n=1 Tax=Microthyrium microscopicum TaxID=703497 RepID=A0A6A6UWV9_9PEZI|nr:YL1-domain-containing protein [Microthyrium microscopicum]